MGGVCRGVRDWEVPWQDESIVGGGGEAGKGQGAEGPPGTTSSSPPAWVLAAYRLPLSLTRPSPPPCREAGWQLDLVCPVPDGSRPAAIQVRGVWGVTGELGGVIWVYGGQSDSPSHYPPPLFLTSCLQISSELKLPYREGLVKNRQVMRLGGWGTRECGGGVVEELKLPYREGLV